MDENRIASLLDEAAEHYNGGRYEQAVSLWQEVLSVNPSEQKAIEGIRMAGLLMTEQEVPGGMKAPSIDLGGVEDRVRAGIERVRSLLSEGRIDQAVEGCAILTGIAPDVDQVRRLAEEVREAAERCAGPRPPDTGESAEGLAAHLEAARCALRDGRNTEAAEAARRALSIDPSNMEACGILSLANDGESASIPLSVGFEDEQPSGSGEVGEEFAIGAIPLHDPEDRSGLPVAEGDRRIEALLSEGQAAFDAGRIEDAIAVWSRIFAIDEANARATDLVDTAKAVLDQRSRDLDDLYFRAVDAHDAGRLEESLGLFQELLSASPMHAEAAACIEEINAKIAGTVDTIRIDPLAAREVAEEKAAAASEDHGVFDGGSEPLAFDPPAEALRAVRPEALPPEKARPSTPVPRRPPAQAPRGGLKRLFVAVAGAVLFFVVAMGAYLWFGSDTGSMAEAQAIAPVATQAPRAPAGPAPSTAALEVLPGAPSGNPAPAPAAPPPADPKRQAAEILREARRHHAQKRWAEAALAYRKAAEIDPLGFDAGDEMDEAIVELEKQARLEEETALVTRYFREQDYGSALHKLYRLQQDYPGVTSFDTSIRNCWFNWGVLLLQAGAVDEAEEKFREAMDIAPRDREAARALEVARRYKGRSRDVAFDSFASSLPVRTFDQP